MCYKVRLYVKRPGFVIKDQLMCYMPSYVLRSQLTLYVFSQTDFDCVIRSSYVLSGQSFFVCFLFERFIAVLKSQVMCSKIGVFFNQIKTVLCDKVICYDVSISQARSGHMI